MTTGGRRFDEYTVALLSKFKGMTRDDLVVERRRISRRTYAIMGAVFLVAVAVLYGFVPISARLYEGFFALLAVFALVVGYFLSAGIREIDQVIEVRGIPSGEEFGNTTIRQGPPKSPSEQE
ncbi:MAG TPA: hypothetical protein VGR25_08025 [bacterium]|nr:hypothetical protein [bacterium]